MGSSKKVKIGYQYFMGMHIYVCLSVDEVQQFIVGERVAWSGSVTSSSQVYVNKPELFGGKKKEGGIQGYVDIMMGEPTQAKNSYLQARLGSVIPAFRGALSLVLRKCYITSMSPYPKPWAVKVKRIPAQSWYPVTAEINGSANPAHIIYDALTNQDWGLGYPETALDLTTFTAAADTLFAESFGLSMILAKQSSVESFIYTILGHCNGMLYAAAASDGTFKFKLKLIRDDYVYADLPTFDESNVKECVYFERAGYGELINEIIVKYRPQGSRKDDSVTVQDLASVQAQEAVVSQEVSYPGIDNATNAGRVGLRDLNQKTANISRARIKVNRKGWNLALGDVIRFSWAEHGADNEVMRILGIDYGTLTDRTITLDIAQDVFSLPSSAYISDQVSGWVDPIQAPAAFTVRRVVEATYWDLVNLFSAGDFAELDASSAFMLALMGEQSGYVSGYDLWTKVAGGDYAFAESSDPVPHATLVAAVTPAQTSFDIENLSLGVDLVVPGTYAYLGNEIVRFDSLVGATVTVGRGCLDTVPAEHALGERIWFSEDDAGFDSTEYITTEQVYAKALTRSADDILDIASAPEDNVTMVGRANLPYPPGNWTLNGLYYPTQANGALTVAWSHRDRTQQLAQPIIDHTATDIGPEAGTTYRVDVYTADGTTLLSSVSGLTGTSWSWTNELAENISGSNRVVVTAVRDGLDSYQSQDWTFERAGIGNNLGGLLGGV